MLRHADLAPLAEGRQLRGRQWNLGAKYKWIAVIALLDIVLVSFMAFMPNLNLGVPWVTGFAWKYVNYTILVFPACLILLWIYWHASVKNWFTGPKHTIDVLPRLPHRRCPERRSVAAVVSAGDGAGSRPLCSSGSRYCAGRRAGSSPSRAA